MADTDGRTRWQGVSASLGLGVLACAACCAPLILAALGLGAGGLAAAAVAWAEPVAVGLLAIAAVLGFVAWKRRAAAGCNVTGAVSCAVDQSCCGPARATTVKHRDVAGDAKGVGG
jgi:hypothetical protein